MGQKQWNRLMWAMALLLTTTAAVSPNSTSFASVSSPTGTVDNLPDPCAVLASIQSNGIATNGSQDPSAASRVPLPVRETWQCARFIKFVPNDALKFLSVAKQFISFHTTLAYLKNPPASYQEPAVDVMGELDQITAKVQDGGYDWQYQFDQDIWRLMVGTHDAHFSILVGVPNLFSYRLNDSIVAFSSDGKELPKIYAYSDINRTAEEGSGFTPSPIKSIEYIDAVDYVSVLAQESHIGAIENHTSWNMIMTDVPFIFGAGSQSDGAIPSYSYFQSRNLYAGESVRGIFENGTNFEWPFQGYVSKPLTNVTCADDIYRDLILASNATLMAGPGIAGASPNAAPPTPNLTAAPYPNYPRNPIVIQEDLGVGGTVSGYILTNESVGVLSLPSFGSDDTGAPSATFIAAVSSFIEKAQSSGVKKVVIDVSGNTGGTVLLAYDTFRRFFPNIYPSAGWRIRAHPIVQTMGQALAVVSTNQEGLFSAADVKAFDHVFHGAFSIAATHLLDAQDGTRFGSWQDYIGPVFDNGDAFSNTARFNFSDLDTASISWKDLNYVAGFGNSTLNYTSPPWAAEDIILLTNGMCGDTCSIFAELLKTDAGVKSVTMGGMPHNGPMQAVGGTRGADGLPWEGIAQGATIVKNLLKEQDSAGYLKAMNLTSSEIEALPPDTSEAGYAVSATINMEDAIRASAPSTPLMFAYEPADCRLFFTQPMITDVTRVWRAAATVLAGDYSACVLGSANVTGSQPNCTTTTAPQARADGADTPINILSMKRSHFGHPHGSNHTSSNAATAGIVVQGRRSAELAMVIWAVAAFVLVAV